ncbi:hypothetical protein BC567DRAFT_232516 [Phyllosticta citribraziliensis]
MTLVSVVSLDGPQLLCAFFLCRCLADDWSHKGRRLQVPGSWMHVMSDSSRGIQCVAMDNSSLCSSCQSSTPLWHRTLFLS